MEDDLREAGYLSAAETARRLGIKLPTLYAYVSRGVLKPERPAGSRASFFAPETVEDLRARPARIARPSLEIPSAVTLLREDALFYRGLDVIVLSRQRTYEEVAELLWQEALVAPAGWRVDQAMRAAATRAQAPLPTEVLPLDRLAVAVAAMAPLDPLRFDLRPATVIRAARSLIATMVSALPTRARSPLPARRASIAAVLARALSPRDPGKGLSDIVNAALILVADHELAYSTLAARVAAATRAPVYAAVSAGLAVLQGPRHGATSLWAEELLTKIAAGETPEAAVAEHLRRGDYLFGFGHSLYVNGDPRAAALLELIFEHASPSDVRATRTLLEFAKRLQLAPPSIDFALAALTNSFRLVRGAGQTIFAVGRSAGWVAHALEEYARRSQYRLRSSYTGPLPYG
jgi:citrate synthase